MRIRGSLACRRESLQSVVPIAIYLDVGALRRYRPAAMKRAPESSVLAPKAGGPPWR